MTPAVPFSSAEAPWNDRTVVHSYYAAALTFAGLVVSWWGTSGAVRNSVLITYLVFGIVTTLAAGAWIAAALSSGRAAVRSRRGVLESRIEDVLERVPAEVIEARSNGRGSGAEVFLSLKGATRFHRADCPLVCGKSPTRAGRAAHERAGRRPCGVCEP